MPSNSAHGTGTKQPVRRIVLAGGGTAGHVEPALAVARGWKEKYPNDVCVFIGTDSGLERTLVPSAGFELRTIEKVTLPRALGIGMVTLPWRLSRSMKTSRAIVSNADLLIGFGGYVSASAYLAAKLEKVPFIVHEANAKPGWANQLGAYLSPNSATTHPIVRGKFSRSISTGLPLRPDVQRAAERAQSDWGAARIAAKLNLEWDVDRPVILILGGSQGSTFINSQIERALPTLVGQGFQIMHSVGAKNSLPPSSHNYRALSYIDDMASAYLAADVVIARSGAVTCAEFAALGRSAIFIPLPSGNGEQARNADFLVEAGRAVVVAQNEFSSDWLIRNIGSAMERAGELEKPGLSDDLSAVEKIVELMENVLERQQE
ncbi:MAG: UDP-N-acetylglucosamine--N-acetylmuramyl-(pentapeptide) pyrophosphoryl-undecaprenol N-acetylglucosamine transferase [Actinobacteria bacterium]|nr:UDP-N-acetylglucosamine--N-acetylmuramyl-(pentapeptide) pyrophosphoryl-undecaprenol N-acetylglucosamine transferase [Actinomycetota bacterium]